MAKISYDNSLGTYLRYLQLIFAIVTFILGIVCVATLPFSDPAVSIVLGIFAITYYVLTLVPKTIAVISPAIALGCEIWLLIWWIVSLGVNAQDFGGVSCTYLRYYSTYMTGCNVGKGLIAMSVFGFVANIISLAFLSIYAIHPLVSANASKLMLNKDAFLPGVLTLKKGFVVPGPTDLEKGAAVDTEAEVGATSATVQPVPADAETNYTQSTEHIKETEEPPKAA